MKTKISSRIMALFLASLMLIGFASCNNNTQNEIKTEETKAQTTEAVGSQTEQETEKEEKYDFNGKPFRIYTSTNVAYSGMGNSNIMIEGDPDSTGDDIVSNAVHLRNNNVSERLNIELEYTHAEFDYTQVTDQIRLYYKSNDDAYDLIINDLYPLVGLSVENKFVNVVDDAEDFAFDFDQKYWYKDYMEDVSIHKDYQFILAGDYFIDVLRSAHCLIYNKELYANIYGKDETLYPIVTNYEWTYAKFYEIIDNCYTAADATQAEPDIEKDRFGLVLNDMWGCMIPMIASGGCDYISRDSEGFPEIDMNVDRVMDLTEALYDVMYSRGTYTKANSDDLLKIFAEGRTMFVGYQRLGSIENKDLQNMASYSMSIIPYPMLKAEEKKYTTSSHDTTEIGVIPVTTKFENRQYISVVIEELCKETEKVVIPEYYETALKIKYASGVNEGKMIDIIHDNFGNVFQLAYDNNIGALYKSVIYDTINNGSTSVSSALGKNKRTASSKLKRIVKQFKEAMDN